jgi:hypothetical protein
LFIARAIVSAHSGYTQVTSSTDAGTTLTVVLPKALSHKRGRVFMNTLRDVGFIAYHGAIKFHKSLLTVVLHD